LYTLSMLKHTQFINYTVDILQIKVYFVKE
jgi:hypothetical protein